MKNEKAPLLAFQDLLISQSFKANVAKTLMKVRLMKAETQHIKCSIFSGLSDTFWALVKKQRLTDQ